MEINIFANIAEETVDVSTMDYRRSSVCAGLSILYNAALVCECVCVSFYTTQYCTCVYICVFLYNNCIHVCVPILYNIAFVCVFLYCIIIAFVYMFL